ncbi:unnamed protein product [Mytilus coruscus]|uniref:Uncharacterized protein n=1 Tax=Mytilus coruscus TaxID=42192 RepID=A0A6J8DRI7_MYTCO|nr:unnamed protein product [Mytilus coruscus]
MQLYTAIVTCVVFISLVGNAIAIDCWVCTSADAGCGESINEETLQDNLKTASGCMGCSKTFKSLGTRERRINEETLQDNLKTASGCMGCSKTFKSLGTIWSEVERRCLTTATDTCDNKLGYGECTCSTTFCNGENKLSIKPLTKMNLLLVLSFVLCISYCHSEVHLDELKPKELVLLNVAVKARLLEKLSEETDKIQFERNELVNRHKACLLNISSTAKACKQCVVNKCENRGKQCQLSLGDLQKIKDEFDNKEIPGLDFLSPPTVVQEEIREIKQTAEKNIMKDVPADLKPKGEEIIEKMKKGMKVFHQNLGQAVNKLPELLPKIEQNIASMSSKIDMTAVEDIANQAAGQISETMNDPTFNGIRAHVVNSNKMLKQNLPSIMKAMGNTLSKLKLAVGRFVGVVRVQAGTAWKQAATDLPNRTNMDTNSQIPSTDMDMLPKPFNLNQQQAVNGGQSMWSSRAQNQLSNNVQFPLQQNGQFQQPQGFPDMQPAMAQGMTNWRKRRQADVPCDQIKARSYEACHSYHFYCPSCMNERTILEHDCGRGALVAMVAIKELDLQAGNDIIKYRQYMDNEEVIKKVHYDKKSLNPDNGMYSRAYVTVQIGEENKIFGTSMLPDIRNIKHAGFILGDELWDILQSNEDTASVRIAQTQEFHNVKAEFLKSENTSSSAVVYGTVWGVVIMVMYMGIVAISVMV